MWLFVTPHALQQFQQRVAMLPANKIFGLVESEAAKGRWIMEQPQREPILQGYYNNQPFYMVLGNGEGSSLSVITILNTQTSVHYKLCRGRSTKVFIPLRELEDHVRSCITQYSR